MGSLSAEAYLETDFLSAEPARIRPEQQLHAARAQLLQLGAGYGRRLVPARRSELESCALYAIAQLNSRSERSPQTIDAQYVAGFNWTRNAQLRFVKSFGKVFSAGLSIESPQASFNSGCVSLVTPAPEPAARRRRSPRTPQWPAQQRGELLDRLRTDIVAKVAVDPGYGHYELYGLARGFRDRSSGTDAGTKNTAWGGRIGPACPAAIGHDLKFQASGLAGSGNGRYGSAQLPDATIKPDGSVVDPGSGRRLPVSSISRCRADPLSLRRRRGRKGVVTNAAGTASIGLPQPFFNNSGCYSLTGGRHSCR